MSNYSPSRNTEKASARFTGLDQWPVDQALTTMLEDQQKALIAIQAVIPAMASAVTEAAQRLSQSPKGRIVYIGAGTPARLGAVDGSELTPTFNWSARRMSFVIAGGRKALRRSIPGAEDNIEDAKQKIAALELTSADVCIAIAASGTTPFTVAACEAAKAAGALTIGIASNNDTPLLKVCDHPLFIDTGAEPIAGSTRMNAGTAQKVALNLISTEVMVQLGRVYDNMMVAMRLNNEKLKKRAAGMVSKISGCTVEEAQSALNKAKGDIRLAVLIKKGLSPQKGKKLLKQKNGRLRKALDSITP